MSAPARRGTTGLVVRARREAGWLLLGLAVLLACSVLALDNDLPWGEVGGFRAVNDRSLLPFAAVWPVMQLGNITAVGLAAVVASVFGRLRLAASLVTAGLLTYVLAKVIKDVVGRPRPGGLLDEVHLRGAEATGYGFVSGHAAVATVVVFLALPEVGRRTAWLLVALATAVGLARLYVGAHLPLDVVGGAALGVMIGAAVRLGIGREASG